MSGELLVHLGPAATSVLALVLSLIGLYLQRRDRSPRLKIRVRYEYRPGTRDEANDGTPRIYDDSQEGLYLLLGDFLREYGLKYPQGSPVVRFAISNEARGSSTSRASGSSSAPATANSETGWCWTRWKRG